MTGPTPAPSAVVADPAAAVAEAGLRWGFDGTDLVTVWEGADFGAALAFVVQVGTVAERLQHHPAIELRWRTVTVSVRSHDVGAITSRDFAFARAVDALVDQGGGTNAAPADRAASDSGRGSPT